jgi:uncharacterized membrane protein YccC
MTHMHAPARSAAWAFPSLPAQFPAWAGFALRNWLASMLALYIAFFLQLDSPVWAWLTVWIVAQPTPGMMLSKSLYRVIGTIAGAILGVILIALFAQTPELFVLALALIVSGCTVASNILTNFRAYATVLAAYTAGIVASDAINTPDQIFFIAMARASCILIGIASAIVVTSIFAPHHSAEAVREKLLSILKDAARRAVYSWKGNNEDRLKIGKELIDDVIATNTLIEYAAAESGTFRLQVNNARSLLAHIFGLISARRSLDAHLHRRGWPEHDGLETYHGVFLGFLEKMPGQLERGEVDKLIDEIHELRHQLALLQPEEHAPASEEVVSERLVIDRMDDLLAHIGGALEDWRDILSEHWKNEPRLVLNFHRDLRLAWINGFRAFIAIIATGAFWIGSAWTHGPLALIFVCVMLSLFSSLPRPDRVGWAFLYASVPAVFFAIFCKYIVLPVTSGFDYLTLASGLFLVPLGLVMANPKTTFPAIAFSFVFLNLVGPNNVMVYDLADTINTGLAIELGVLVATLCFVVIFPPNPAAARRYVTYRIRLGLGKLAALSRTIPFCQWESRMYDRVNRLHDPENLSGTNTDEWLDAGLGAVTLGNEILRLRRWMESEPMSPEVRAAVGKTLHLFANFCLKPQRAFAQVKREIAQLAPLDPGQGHAGRRIWARVLGAMEEMEVYLSHHPRLLKMEPVT